jgi:urea carboxylase
VFDKVLIANRGAIACRIQRTLHRLGIASVAVYSEADANAPHVRAASEAFCLGPAPAAQSYLRAERIIEVAKQCGAQAIHPGYGFLSENAGFAAACEAAGIAFIGPTPAQIAQFGLKHTARALAGEQGLPLLPGSSLLADVNAALAAAERIGYPVMLKSTAGGGGIGMQQCADAAALRAAFAGVQRLAAGNFSNAGVFVEKYIARARHIEVQVFGDGQGRVVALGERDCSLQRRNQKVIEEAPAPGLARQERERLHQAALRLAAAVSYRSAGTVEFVYDADTGQFYFLEVNTRLQVEHGVTEQVGGIDLVEWMVRVAAGDWPVPEGFRFEARGHAIQARIYAEDPLREFRPCGGLLTEVRFPDDVRVDGWVETGAEVTGHYDPLLAKVIVHADDRGAALARMDAALAQSRVRGIESNLAWLRTVLSLPEFVAGAPTTRLLASHHVSLPVVEVIEPGTMTTVQDWPGRTGAWDVGVPPSGPMDALSFRLANRLVGNDADAAGLEMTATGATLRFAQQAVVALTGAPMEAALDGRPVAWWQAFTVPAGSTLAIGATTGRGQRAYLAIAGGLDVPEYMGSRATFTLGGFGGHGGRALRAGDVLWMQVKEGDGQVTAPPGPAGPSALPPDRRPRFPEVWTIGVIEGPHGAPDFFTRAYLETFYDSEWQVHYNSSRTGVRLAGPKPEWARPDGGEAGLHPSNIHDNAYAVGSIDFTGDMPVILGPDGPSLGGFVCPATVALAQMWKLGQLRPGDRVRFTRWSVSGARRALAEQEAFIADPWRAPMPAAGDAARTRRPVRGRSELPDGVIARLPADVRRAEVVVRQSGEDNLLVEFGAPELDLALRFQVQALLVILQQRPLRGQLELTPGIRSLQVHFDAARVSQRRMLAHVLDVLGGMPDIERMELPGRVVHLPLSWNDPAVRLATGRYMQSVRADAPWCPDNIEFIRRINGLGSVEEVRRIVFDASYLVMGLGDVYLGAPVATPLDPRHRLVTTKYNPARTWTPENAVGIGGAYLCVYGMEGPGGYQLVGRTVQMWNRFREGGAFTGGKRWLLRFFDQIRFFPVEAEELLAIRERFPWGGYPLRIEPATLRLGDYRHFLAQHADSIAAFRTRQQVAFREERERWKAAGVSEAPVAEPAPPPVAAELPAGCIAVRAPVSGNVWQLRTAAGRAVAAGEELLVMESMKMEISVRAQAAGEVVATYCNAGRPANAGDLLVALRPAGGVAR